MFQLMPLPLTVSCFSKIKICFTFLVPAHQGSPGKRAIKTGVCVLLASSLRHKVVIEHREIFIQSQPYTQFFFSVVAQWQARSLFPQKCCNNRSNFYKLDTIPVAPNHWKQLSSITISRNHICNETCNVTFCTYCGFTEISRSIVFSRSSSSMHFFICSAPAQTNML